jgi:hypothetical protein
LRYRFFIVTLHKRKRKTIKNMEILKFIPGKNYQMKFITDSDLKVPFVCVARTEKTVHLENKKSGEIIKRKVKVYDNTEYVLAGSYSMAPSIKAIAI